MEMFQSPEDVVRYFSNEQRCIDLIIAERWPGGVTCPGCGIGDPYYIQTQRRWKCRSCHWQFSAKVGTVFEDSPVPITKWMAALWFEVNPLSFGVSSYDLARILGITQKSAWKMQSRLRVALSVKKRPEPADQKCFCGSLATYLIIGRENEPVCNEHFDWYSANTRRLFDFRELDTVSIREARRLESLEFKVHSAR